MELALCTRAAGLTTAAGGLLVLLAWAQVPGLSAFTIAPPSTGLSLLALGAALHNESGQQRISVRVTLGGFLVLLGVLALLHYGAGWGTGMPQMLFTDSVRERGGPHAGYPSPHAAIVLVCYGIALLALRREREGAFHPADMFSILGISVILLAWIGYLHNFAIYFATQAGKAISMPAAALLLVAGAGLICARPDTGFMAILRDRSSAGMTARRLLPIPFLIPAFTAWLSQAITRVGWLDAWQGQWVFSYANIVLYVLIIWRSVALLTESNQRGRVAEEALQEAYEKLDTRVRERTSELTIANATLRALIEASPLGIVALDRRGHVRIWNRAAERTLGWNSDEISGAAIPAGPGTQLRSVLQRILQGEDLTGVEFEHQRDGTAQVLSAWSAQLRSDEGVQGFVLALADLTEQRRLESELRQAQKMDAIGRLAGGVAHDFNNLLTAIIGLSEVIYEGLGPQEPLREDVLEIRSAGERAAALTRQLLAFSRSQMVQPEILDLNKAVADLERMLRRLISEDIELRTVLEPDLPPVLADRTHIEQVILNLVINARDAMAGGGRLTLATNSGEFNGDSAPQGIEAGRYVMLTVSDTGVGMDAETKSRMFDPFFTTKPQGQGTGLGLSTVYGIVRQSKGAIQVDSEPGQGTTLRIYFPVAERTKGPEPLRQFIRERPRGTETVLVVEDEPAVRALARKVLTGGGYQVLEAEDAADALSVAHQQNGPIHLLLADVVMPHMSGRELAESLAVFYPDAKVLFMSGHTEDAVIRHGVETRGIPFLQKPFTPDSLARKVREVLDS